MMQCKDVNLNSSIPYLASLSSSGLKRRDDREKRKTIAELEILRMLPALANLLHHHLLYFLYLKDFLGRIRKR